MQMREERDDENEDGQQMQGGGEEGRWKMSREGGRGGGVERSEYERKT